MEKLTEKERQALKEAGIEVVIFFAVVDESNGIPLAIFQYETWAEKWKKVYSATSTIEEYNMQIKS